MQFCHDKFLYECWIIQLESMAKFYVYFSTHLDSALYMNNQSLLIAKVRNFFKPDDSFSLINLNSVIFRLKNVLNQIQRWFGSQSGCPVRPPEGNSFFKTGNAVLLNSSHRVEQPQDKYLSFRKHFRHVRFKAVPLHSWMIHGG